MQELAEPVQELSRPHRELSAIVGPTTILREGCNLKAFQTVTVSITRSTIFHIPQEILMSIGPSKS